MKWFTTSQQFFSDSEESEQEMISSDESDMKQTSIRFQPNQDIMLKSELQEAQQYCNMLKDQVERLRNVAYAAGHKQLVKVACDLKSYSEQMNKKLMHASELLTDDKQTEKSLSPSSSVSSTSSSVSNTSCSSDITPPKHEVQAVSKQLKPHILPNSTYQMFEFPSERKKPSSITSIKRPRASTMVVSGPPPSREQTRIPVKQFTSTKPIPPPKPRMVTSITLKDVSKQVKSHRLSLPGTTVSTEKHSSTHQASKLTVATSNSQPSTLRTARFPIKYKPPPPPKPVWSSVCVPLKKFSDSHNRDNQFTRALAVGPNADDDYYEVSFNGKGYAFFGEASQIKKTEKPTQFPAMPLPVIHIVEVSGTTQASHKGPPPPTKPKPNSKLLASHSIKPETAAYSTPGSGDSGICVTHSLPAHIVGVSGDLLQDHGPRYVNIPAHGNEHVYESIDDLENNYK